MSAARQLYCQQLRQFSDTLVQLQTPIKILDAIKWPREMEQRFLATGGSQLPAIDKGFYDALPLPFAPHQVQQELKQLKQNIHKTLGKQDPLGRLLVANVEQYRQVIDMLTHRGTPTFGRLSQQLYGSADNKLHGDRHTLRQLGDRLSYIFSLPAASHMNKQHPKNLDAATAVTDLSQRLGRYFHSDEMRVRLSDGIVSDAAVGGDTVKINSKAMFSQADLNVYEVHEGWVHVGTTLNGRAQPHATWLSVGSPRVAAAQEGLAVLLEMLTLSSTPGRARRISDRVTAVDMAEKGADFIEVFRYFREQDLSEKDSYRVTQRVFRGGMVAGGSCFTKDISYVRGYVENVNFIRSAIASGLPELIPMLFLGKLAIEDIPTLYLAYRDGILTAPRYLPPMFEDYSGLYAWFGFASGLGNINLKGVQRHFQRQFRILPNVEPLYAGQEETEFDSTVE
ncbi:flavohemoglobin expression-modulating QEGLA motif protein [Shewanella cyperi]|uniref:Flavohemoglobin expression-modulating QEGLA motif protein n=1 Tax=Shewanella cyperi TaxID=2814292 RepID=A0A974XSD8_9GAMM|nr:flavohemoglobin expression-modulating QEGLA motif protein [Shewanella cyperi]QSX29604.1 flavohemoglobin expression-modulating QEGLA motif protein [Shewanella cyperi]QSX40386.1 flavohemoglobin expression-modulating QEGLA motif protein [Shewanella cyperi]